MPGSDWFDKNREAVIQRVTWLRSKPNGVLCEKQSAFHRIVILKDANLLRMCFVDPAGSREELTWTGGMSVLKLEDPLDLSPTPYNQALMLTLLWRSQPERVYVAGFGGGRMPLAFHHHFPQAVIDSTEIDIEVSELAGKYFGIEYDRRQRLHIIDARKFLESAELNSQYDLMLVDAFCGGGDGPVHLATKEFYRACKMRLKPGGVVAVNLVESDPAFGSKMATMACSFENTYVQMDRTTVVFCVDAPLIPRKELMRRAESIQREHSFAFDFIQGASRVEPLGAVERLRALVEQSAVLTDIDTAGRPARNS